MICGFQYIYFSPFLTPIQAESIDKPGSETVLSCTISIYMHFGFKVLWGKADSPACGRARSAGKRAPGTFSDTPPLRIHSSQRPIPSKSTILLGWCFCLVGEGGFEPPKALPADLQSVPFGHSGIPPYSVADCQVELVDGFEPPTC